MPASTALPLEPLVPLAPEEAADELVDVPVPLELVPDALEVAVPAAALLPVEVAPDPESEVEGLHAVAVTSGTARTARRRRLRRVRMVGAGCGERRRSFKKFYPEHGFVLTGRHMGTAT